MAARRGAASSTAAVGGQRVAHRCSIRGHGAVQRRARAPAEFAHRRGLARKLSSRSRRRVDRDLGDDPARARRHHDDAGRQIDALVDRVGDEDDRAAEFALQAQEVVVELEAGDLVERREGLVHEEELRPQRQGAGDRDAHLHAARQLARIGVREAGEADEREALLDPRPRPRASETPRRRSGSQTLSARVRPGHQRRLLEHEADLAAVVLARRDPGHSTLPAVGSARPAMMRSAVDLPQPEGPSRDTNSPGRDVEIEPGERRRAVREGLADAAQSERRRWRIAMRTSPPRSARVGCPHVRRAFAASRRGAHASSPQGGGRSLLLSSAPTPLFTNCSV